MKIGDFLNINRSKKNKDNLILKWQEKICDAIFLSLSLLGLIAYIPSFILSLRDNLFHIAIIDSLAYLIILLVTFNNKISYFIKALIGSIVFYILGLLLLILLGPIGTGNLWLLGFTLISSLTLGDNAGKISFFINLLTQIILFILIKTGIYINDLSSISDSNIWLIRVVNFTVVNLVIVISTSVLTKELHKTFKIQKESQKKLTDSENKMRTIFENTTLGMMLIRINDSIILEANNTIKLLLGFNNNEILNTTFNSLVHPDEINKVYNILKLEENITFDEFKFIHKNSIPISTTVTIVKIKISNTKEECFLAMIRDITQEKLMEETKIHLQEELLHSQKMDALGQLAGGMAHDINNVLNGILNASQLMKLPKMELNSKNTKYVDIIIQSSLRASNLIKKLLAFSRKDKIETETLDIHDILNDTIEILKSTINKKIKITLNTNALNCNIIGDISGIESTFINLCINSSHVMPEGGDITITTDNIYLDQESCNSSSFHINPGQFIEIVIIDTGSGISEENIHKIYEPFFTTKDVSSGTGLGLSAVYGTIKEHHGSIEVKSSIGIGTTFNLLLPCTNETVNEKEQLNPIIYGTGCILVVDDEEINRVVIKDILESLGYNVYLAKNGFEGINIFNKRHKEIDIVIMDMMMPIMNGSEAFYKMKEIDKECKVIISSGYIKNENMDLLRENGLSGYIEKPFRISEFSSLLNKIR